MTDLPDLLYIRARYYSPSVGRFINKDPIGLKGGINQYIYVGNAPVIFIDALGFQAGLPDYIIGAGLIGFGAVAVISQQYYIGVPLIVAGLALWVFNPITEYFIQRPLENAARRAVDLQKKRLEDYENFYREQSGQCGVK